jgi:hypothetical protein
MGLLCLLPARRTRAFFDPEQSVFCREQGFVDISPKADGGVLKKVGAGSGRGREAGKGGLTGWQVLRDGDFEKRHIEEGCPTFGAWLCQRGDRFWG